MGTLSFWQEPRPPPKSPMQEAGFHAGVLSLWEGALARGSEGQLHPEHSQQQQQKPEFLSSHKCRDVAMPRKPSAPSASRSCCIASVHFIWGGYFGALRGPSRLDSGSHAELASTVVGGTREQEAGKPQELLLSQREPPLHLHLF